MRLTFQGGLNENDGTRPEECQAGQNFELNSGDTDLRPRKPLDLKGTATNAGDISGLMQLIKRDDTGTTLVFEDDGVTPTIYSWDGSTTFTSKRTDNLAIGSKLRDVHWDLDEYIVMVDVEKLTPLMQWDGTTCIRHKTGLLAGSAQAITSITRSGTVATVTSTGSHGYTTGDLVHIIGAVETDYNGEYEITVNTTTEFTYTVANAPATPATGTITADIGTELYAKYGIVYQSRLWLFNITTNDGTATEVPHMLLASAFEDPISFDSAKRSEDSTFATGNEAFYILSKDLKPINGVAVFNSNLVISTQDGRLYRLIGTDSRDYEFVEYYSGSAAIGKESIANIGNDIVYMRKGGNIESLIATETSGDVSINDISKWIPDTVKDLSDSKIVYDQSNQKVFFFVTDKVLVLFKDLLYGSEFSPWSVYTTQLTDDFNTNAVRYMRRPNEDTWSVYFGDSSGNIYDLNGSGNGDNDTNILTQRTTNVIEEMNTKQGTLLGRIQYRRYGECECTLSFDWTDEYNTTTSTITLSGAPPGDTASFYNDVSYYGGDFYYNKGFAYRDKISTRGFSPTGRAISFIMQTSLDTKVRFKVDHIDLGV